MPRIRIVFLLVVSGLLFMPVGLVSSTPSGTAGTIPHLAVPAASPAPSTSPPSPSALVPFFPNIDIIDHSTPYAWQVEPTMVVNKSGTIFAGWKETDSADDAGFRVGASYSTDQGRTWAPNILMNQTHTGDNCRDSDPWMALSPDDRVHYAYLEYDPSGGSSPPCGSGLDVSNTTNGHWGTVHYVAGATGGLVDKDSIALDRFGRLYATWDEGNVLEFTWSDNGGNTWAPVKSPDNAASVLGATVVPFGNTTVYLVWWDFSVNNILFISSNDRGSTWTLPARVNDRDGSASGGFPEYPLPAFIVDPKTGTLYASWADSRNGNPDIYFANSTDGGKTWGTNHKINDNSGSSTQWMPALAVDGTGKVHAAWEDRRTGNLNIFYANSTDGGATWTPNIKVTTAETPNSYDRPGDYFTIVAGPNNYIYIVWTDGRGKDFDIYYARNPGFPSATVTVATSPTGLPVTVDNVTAKSPVTQTWILGSNHTISVAATLAAGPSARWTWTNWSDGGARVHTVTATSDGTVTAYFKKQFFAAVGTNPVGLQVYVDHTPYSQVATFWWDNGSTHSLNLSSPQYLTSSLRYTWVEWSDGLTSLVRSVVASGAINLTAIFLQQQALRISTDPAGVAFTFDGTTYTGAQTFWLQNNTFHTVNTGGIVNGSTGVRYLFTSWSDNGARNHVIDFTGPTVLTASFSIQYYLTVTSAAPGASSSGWYAAGATATATVTYSTYMTAIGTRLMFSGWSGDASGSGVQSNPIVMDGPKNAVAAYTTQYYLQVQSAFATASGSGWYNAGTSATASVSANNVSLGSGRRESFVAWGTDASGNTGSASSPILMDRPKTATAQWQKQYYVDVTSDAGSLSGTGWYADGTTVTIQAPAQATIGGQSESFTGWSGDVSSTSASLMLTVTQPFTIHANYAASSLFGSSTTTFSIALIVLAAVILAFLFVWLRRRKKPPAP